MNATNKLLSHFKAMQSQCADYVCPEVYIDREGYPSDNGDGLEREGLRNRLFANDMVYMLDGPEQREAQAAAEFDFLGEALTTLSPHWHGEMVSRYNFVGALNNAIAALRQLDMVKKTLFYGRDNGLSGPDSTDNVQGLPERIATDSELDRTQAEYFIHGAIGYATEAGEMLEALRAAMNGQGVDRVNVMEESGDGKWYLAVLAHACGYAWGEDERRVTEKLRARFPEKFTEHDANNRNLARERDILEGGKNNFG